MIPSAIEFLSRLHRTLQDKGVHWPAHWDVDHICYRTPTDERYQELKKEFQSQARLMIESEVNGRMISTFRLHEPILFQDWRIDLLELPAPKKNKPTPEGFEHVEVVCDQTFDELKSRFAGFEMNDGGLRKNFNQELEVSFDGLNVKFHHLSLESVVTLEGNDRVWTALHSLGLLESLKNFSPLVVGTFPLNVAVPRSDVDVLLNVKDQTAYLKVLGGIQPRVDGWVYEEKVVDGLPTQITRFTWKNIPFELFAQARPTIHQRAALHFLAEERLLKWGGEKFRQNVIAQRLKDLKTEPAFAKALKISGDSYLELLRLQKATNKTLQALLFAAST